VLLVAAATSTTGGGERHVADLLRLLPARGIEVGLAAPPGGDLEALAGRRGVTRYEAGIGGGLSLAGMRQLRAAIGAFAPDVVHAHGSRAAFYARIADPKADERCVYTVHGIHIDKAGGLVRRGVLLRAERLLRGRTAAWVTVCRSDVGKGAALGILDAARSTVVHNGTPLVSQEPARGAFRAAHGIAEDAPLALSMGRFHEQKDQATLLRAWALVHERRPDAVLALAGAGELARPLEALASSLRLGDSMRFVGPLPDPALAYADADLFCLSSLWEGLPYVVLEAMSYRLPVVSTGVDGIPEAVADGESGLLVGPRDSGALADAIVRLLDDPDVRARMGAAGERIVRERFGIERMADEIAALYRSLVSGPPA
jgi:glycosyltransferase involved in cell wall biosynthesis